MNLTVEWVHFGDFMQGPGLSDDYKPVIRVDALRKWLDQQNRYTTGLDDLLAQLPEAGMRIPQ